MRLLALYLSLALAVHSSIARLFHSLPEDTYAFPKFRVSFLNSLPVLNETAQRWLDHGLAGGEPEFLEQYRKFTSTGSPYDNMGIESGQYHDEPAEITDEPTLLRNFVVERLKLGSKESYVCLIPKPLESKPLSPGEEQPSSDLTPERSWSLLAPLSGSCLYHRHGWFTYSYCHNDEIRQFRELVPQTPRLAGSYVPEADPEWESYTLGRAPTQPPPGADLTVAEQNAQAHNLELAKTAGSRYLVQRWGDGTPCDKTGKNREVEVQFHCSMTTTDNILFVKETKTCSYVLVVNTPRLCGEPGFKSRRDAALEAEIRCREIVNTLPEHPLDLPVTDFPMKYGQQPVAAKRNHKLPAADSDTATSKSGDKSDDNTNDPEAQDRESGDQRKEDKIVNDLFIQTIETLMKKGRSGKVRKPGEHTEIVVELSEGAEDGQGIGGRLMDALRSAGYDVLNAEFLGRDEYNDDGDDDDDDTEGTSTSGKREDKKKRFRRLSNEADGYIRDEL